MKSLMSPPVVTLNDDDMLPFLPGMSTNYLPENHGDDEERGALCEGGVEKEGRVEGVEQHGDHHHVHRIPVGEPAQLHDPPRKVQIKPGCNCNDFQCFFFVS